MSVRVPYTYDHVTLLYVVDGDTLRCDFDHGGKPGSWSRGAYVRLAFVDAAPIETAKGLEAKVFVETFLPQRDELVTGLVIRSLGMDAHYRYVSTVQLPSGDDLGQLMLDHGMAEPWSPARAREMGISI